MDLHTWKTESDPESAITIPHNSNPTYPPASAFNLSPLPPQPQSGGPASASEMISMEMPPMGHIGQPHPASGHHQPQMSPNYDSSCDKKKRECMFLFFILEHGLFVRNTAIRSTSFTQIAKIIHQQVSENKKKS